MTDDLHTRLRQLALQKVDQTTQSFATEKRHTIKEFFHLFIDDQSVFEQLYQAYCHNLQSSEVQSQHAVISYMRHDTLHTITFLNKKFVLDEDSFSRLLSNTIEILRETLPLGTAVELDPDYFKLDSQSESPAKIVITGRFVAPANFNSYFPYAGVVYPIGEIKPDTTIHFTAPLIRQVVHMGFKDEVDDAYELLMKQEFIVEKNMNSIAFSETDMKKLQKEMHLESR